MDDRGRLPAPQVDPREQQAARSPVPVRERMNRVERRVRPCPARGGAPGPLLLPRGDPQHRLQLLLHLARGAEPVLDAAGNDEALVRLVLPRRHRHADPRQGLPFRLPANLHRAIALMADSPRLPTPDLLRIERRLASGVIHHPLQGGQLVEQQRSQAVARVADLDLVLGAGGLEPLARQAILCFAPQPIDAFHLTRLDREAALQVARPYLRRPFLHAVSRPRAPNGPPNAQIGFEFRIGRVPRFRVQWPEAPPGSGRHTRLRVRQRHFPTAALPPARGVPALGAHEAQARHRRGFERDTARRRLAGGVRGERPGRYASGVRARERERPPIRRDVRSTAPPPRAPARSHAGARPAPPPRSARRG